MIKLINVSKFYHEGNVVTLGLRKINLEFNIGEFVAITGESGSGKSTLLNVISGIDTYEDGEILIDGEETSYFGDDDWERYRKNYIGFIFQNYNLIDSYTVLENVEAAMIIQGISKKERRIRAKEIIEKVGLTSHIKHRATKLSGGQRQRLAIARALAKNTKIIVADEPTGNLDSASGKQIMELLHTIAKEKLVLMVTHNYEEAESYVTRKIRLFDGEVVEDREIKPFNEVIETKENSEQIKESSWKKAFVFSLFNLKNQPKRTTLLLLVTFFATFFVFLMCALYFTTSTLFSSSLFPRSNYYFDNSYEERIVATKTDGKEITDEEINAIKNIRGVKCIIDYDIILDYTIYLFVDEFNMGGYIRSSNSLSKNDLSAGVLPVKDDEVVVCGNFSEKECEKILNQTVSCYFAISPDSIDLKIVGIYNIESLSQSSDFIYVSDEFFNKYAKNTYANNFRENILLLIDDAELELKDIVYVDNNLEGIKIILPNYYSQYNDFKNVKINGDTIPFEINSDINDYYVFISQELFDKYIGAIRTQITVEADSPSDVTRIMNKLSQMDFYSTCPYLTSTDIGAIINIVISIIMIFYCGAGLVVVYIVTYLVIKAILLNKKKDYTILRTIGIDNKTIKNMSKVEMLIAFTIAFIIIMILFIIFKLCKIQYISAILNSVGFVDCLVIFIINILMSLLISRRFNNLLMKKSLLTNLKVE